MATKDGSPNLMDLMRKFPTEEAARTYLEGLRWPNGPVCPHCGVQGNSAKLEGAAHRAGVYKCRDCLKQYTVTVGTVMERSHIGLDKWVIAFHLLAASKKGMSAHQLHRMMGITYKCAWHMGHRIRYAMQTGSLESNKLDGVVEIDETYVGGKAKNVHNGKPVPKKTPVVALVSRDGKMKARVVVDVNAKTIKEVLKRHVKPGAEIFSDGAPFYPAATEGLSGHESVNHDAGEYVRGVVHINTAESFNALVKRGIIGIYHHVSETHLDRYLDEFTFRWDNRNVSDGKRTETALIQSEGKRLMYKECRQEARVD